MNVVGCDHLSCPLKVLYFLCWEVATNGLRYTVAMKCFLNRYRKEEIPSDRIRTIPCLVWSNLFGSLWELLKSFTFRMVRLLFSVWNIFGSRAMPLLHQMQLWYHRFSKYFALFCEEEFKCHLELWTSTAIQVPILLSQFKVQPISEEEGMLEELLDHAVTSVVFRKCSWFTVQLELARSVRDVEDVKHTA